VRTVVTPDGATGCKFCEPFVVQRTTQTLYSKRHMRTASAIFSIAASFVGVRSLSPWHTPRETWE